MRKGYCFNTCPLNAFGLTCTQCDPRCKYCSGFGPMQCLRCNSDEENVVQSSYWYNEKTCVKDFGYYKANSTVDTRYAKCDYRCLICKDSTNVCEVCAPGAFRYLGTLCLTTCPADYFGSLSTGLCEKRSASVMKITKCNQASSCTDQELCFNQTSRYVKTSFLGVRLSSANMILLEFTRPVKVTDISTFSATVNISISENPSNKVTQANGWNVMEN